MSEPLTLSEVQLLIGGTVIGDPNILLIGVAGLEEASKQEISFLANPRYLPLVSSTQAGVVVLPPGAPLPPSGNALIHENPSLAFQTLLKAFKKTLPPQSYFQGVHPLAYVADGAQLGENVTISPFAVIEKGALIGNGSFIGSHCYVGPHVKIGNDCWIHPHVTIREGVVIHDRVQLQPGAVIGSCGFGYIPDGEGHFKKLDQLGKVVIEKDVEIGANTTIDRARFAETVVGAGTKIDNLVQVGHNVRIGKDCILVSGVGIGGSTEIGDRTALMAKVAVNGHITIASDTRVAACSAVQRAIKERGDYGGFPLVPIKEFHRNYVIAKQLSRLAKRIQNLEQSIQAL